MTFQKARTRSDRRKDKEKDLPNQSSKPIVNLDDLKILSKEDNQAEVTEALSVSEARSEESKKYFEEDDQVEVTENLSGSTQNEFKDNRAGAYKEIQVVDNLPSGKIAGKEVKKAKNKRRNRPSFITTVHPDNMRAFDKYCDRKAMSRAELMDLLIEKYIRGL